MLGLKRFSARLVPFLDLEDLPLVSLFSLLKVVYLTKISLMAQTNFSFSLFTVSVLYDECLV